MVRKVVQFGHVPVSTVRVTRIRQAGIWVPQFVEEGVHHCVDSGQTLGRRVLEEFRDQIDCVGIGLPEHLMLSALLYMLPLG